MEVIITLANDTARFFLYHGHLDVSGILHFVLDLLGDLEAQVLQISLSSTFSASTITCSRPAWMAKCFLHSVIGHGQVPFPDALPGSFQYLSFGLWTAPTDGIAGLYDGRDHIGHLDLIMVGSYSIHNGRMFTIFFCTAWLREGDETILILLPALYRYHAAKPARLASLGLSPISAAMVAHRLASLGVHEQVLAAEERNLIRPTILMSSLCRPEIIWPDNRSFTDLHDVLFPSASVCLGHHFLTSGRVDTDHRPPVAVMTGGPLRRTGSNRMMMVSGGIIHNEFYTGCCFQRTDIPAFLPDDLTFDRPVQAEDRKQCSQWSALLQCAGWSGE